ncbi:MAG: PTPA-CTERM sorting domain-containing protein [Leptolyngbyaceae cyanobacterium]
MIASNGSLVGAELPPGAPVPPFGLGPNGGTVVPTPAMLPGLISMGIAAWRKRRQEEMAGEQGADPVLEEV